jgi:hypothetical protein
VLTELLHFKFVGVLTLVLRDVIVLVAAFFAFKGDQFAHTFLAFMLGFIFYAKNNGYTVPAGKNCVT